MDGLDALHRHRAGNRITDMYQLGGWLDWFTGSAGAKPADRTRQKVPRNVILLGLTSLFTDISSEMVVSVLPVYLIGFLRMSPAQFGLIDGLYQGVGGVVQLVSAVATDRFKRYKEVAALGYGTSLLCRVGLLATSGTAGITAILTLDRLGKGMRTAPRDAPISLSVPREYLGTAFGIHRAMDALGAMLGPIIAFAILRVIVDGFDVVFVFSLCGAIIGIAILGLFVEKQAAADRRGASTDDPHFSDIRPPSSTAVSASGSFGAPARVDDHQRRVRCISRFRVEAVFRRAVFHSLYALTSAGYLLFAIPVGKLADRVGRFPVFLAGHALLIGL